MSSMHILARFALPAMLLVFACNGDKPQDTSEAGDGNTNEDGNTSGDGDPDEARSSEPHDKNPQLEPGEADVLAAGNHALTLDLYHALRDGQAAGEGFSISAYSIQGVFGMLYAGALEPARSQIAETLHFNLEDERQHVAHNWLDAELEKRNLPANNTGDDDAGDNAVVLRSANSLWVLDDLGDQISAEYLDLLAIHYDAGLKLAAFDVQPEIERATINAWVYERSNGLIPELFPVKTIHEYTTLVLVNAVYLKAPWLEPFSAGYTEPQDFTRLNGEVISVEMMRAPELMTGRHVVGLGYQAAALPLRGGDLEFLVILPDDFDTFEDGLDEARLAEVLIGLAPTNLDLSIPKFDLEASFELSPELESLGMVAPFIDMTSFDAIHEDLDRLEVVVHDTVIKIDEDGLEAAAASGSSGDGDGDGDGAPPTIMVVDRPFLLAIHDKPTNTLLFFGRVLDPNE